MDMLKRLLRGLGSQAFKVAIFLVATSAATVIVFGSPDRIKNSLNDSGVYDRATDSILEQITKDPSVASSEVPADDPEIQKVLKDTLSPEFLEQTSTSAIDGVFDWLRGQTEKPEFKIDLTATKTE